MSGFVNAGDSVRIYVERYSTSISDLCFCFLSPHTIPGLSWILTVSSRIKLLSKEPLYPIIAFCGKAWPFVLNTLDVYLKSGWWRRDLFGCQEIIDNINTLPSLSHFLSRDTSSQVWCIHQRSTTISINSLYPRERGGGEAGLTLWIALSVPSAKGTWGMLLIKDNSC